MRKKVDEKKLRQAFLLIADALDYEPILLADTNPDTGHIVYLVAMPKGYEGNKRKTEYMIRTSLPNAGHGEGFSFKTLPDALKVWDDMAVIGLKMALSRS